MTMRVIFRVDSGPTSGHRLLLRAGETLKVGRSSFNDFPVEHDQQMSAEHFRINVGESACFLVDADTANGTAVNGHQIRRATLSDGDTIVAGTTRFIVNVEGADAAVSARKPETLPAVPPLSKQPIPIAKPREFCIETLPSGLNCCRDPGGVNPNSLATQLMRQAPLYLIADLQRVGEPLPASETTPCFLFDWIQAEAAEAISPVILTAANCGSWPAVVEHLWNKNAIVLLFSNAPANDFIQQLLSLTRQDETESILGWCWPKVLGAMLECGEPNLTDRLTSNVDFFLIEDDAEEDGWKLIGSQSLSDALRSIGWSEQQLEI